MSPTGSPSGRPREFDVRDALDALVACFWRTGYSATTYADMETATGLHRQSLVYAFGDKRSLFMKALDHYAERRVGALLDEVERAPSPLAGLRNAVESWMADAERRATPGCLLVNTAGELGCRDVDIAAVVQRSTDRLIAGLTRAIRAGQSSGQLSDRVEPSHLATLMVATADGAMLHARSADDPRVARAALRALLELLEQMSVAGSA